MTRTTVTRDGSGPAALDKPRRSAGVATGNPGRTIAQYAADKAQQQPDTVAFRFDDGSSLRFAEVWAEAKVLAASLQQLGLTQGDTLSFQLPNWREAVVINLAAAALGLVVNPITPIYRGAELRHILSDSRSRILFIPDRYRSIDYAQMIRSILPYLPDLTHTVLVRSSTDTSQTYEELLKAGRGKTPTLPSVDASDTKLLLYTSGTTGRAKGVLHAHGPMDAGNRTSAKAWSMGPEDVMLMPSPVTHITGYSMGLELPFFSESTVAFIDRWDASRAVPFIDEVGATLCVAATPFLKELIDEAERQGSRLPSMRLFACGGASVSPDLIMRAAQATTRMRAVRVYGATEVPLITKGFIGDNELGLAAETDGRVIGYEIKVVDGTGQCVPEGRAGEILVRGPSMMIGYTDKDETAKAVDADGFFRTGDIGMLTSDGAIVITARLKDLIIRGGENLSPKEIEDALMRHPAIAEVAVVSMPHPRLGEGVCAYVAVRSGFEAPTLMDLADFLEREGLARQKFPERVEYIADFPRTPSGKIRKDVLRDALRQPLVVRVTA